MQIFFYGLKSTCISILNLHNLVLLLIGFLSTYFLVIGGFDWWYFTYFAGSLVHLFLFPGVILGAMVPILTPLFLFIYGKMNSDKRYINWAGLVGQAAFVGWLLSSTLKAFTGRWQPNMQDLITDISGGFNFGFWEHGIFWGWPSSHTTVAFSVAFAIVYSLAQKEKNFNRKISILLIVLYAFYIGVGVSVSIHWFSDFVMGAILGFIIGRQIGKTFQRII